MLAHTNVPFKGHSEIRESGKLHSKPLFYYFSLGAPEYSGGLIIGGLFAPEIWGAYFREGVFLDGLIRILRYINNRNTVRA